MVTDQQVDSHTIKITVVMAMGHQHPITKPKLMNHVGSSTKGNVNLAQVVNLSTDVLIVSNLGTLWLIVEN